MQSNLHDALRIERLMKSWYCPNDKAGNELSILF